MEKDVIEDLRDLQEGLTTINDYDAACAVLNRAIAEITRLRSLAGAVSEGQSAAEVLAPLHHKATYTD